MKRIFLLLFLLWSADIVSQATSCTPYAPTPDERLQLSSLSINGRVFSVHKLEPLADLTVSRYEAGIEVLAVHPVPGRLKRESPPRTIRVIFQISNGYDGEPIVTENQPIPKIGARYAFFLRPEDQSWKIYTTTPFWTDTPGGMNLLPLHDNQPDDAPLLLEKDAEAIAIAELRKLRPELKDLRIEKTFQALHWIITLSNTETPTLPEAQVVIDTAGRISDITWITAEPVRAATKLPEEDFGALLVFHLKSDKILLGRATSTDANRIRGDFYGSGPAAPTYEDHLRTDELLGTRRLAVAPAIRAPRPAPTGMIGWSMMLTLDHAAYQAPLIVNGCVTAAAPLDIPLPEAYRKRELKGEAQWLDVKVLATLKGNAPEIIRLPYIAQKAPAIKIGGRYTFLLQREDSQLIMAYPHDPHFTVIPLSDDQPDGAPLLLESEITRIAKAEYARHRSEPDYYHASASRRESGWSVGFYGYGVSAEFLLTQSGRIVSGWVAAESPRSELRESDLGKPLRFSLYPSSNGERRAFFGVLESVKPDALIGRFQSLSGEPPLQRIAKQDLASVQQLALSPSRTADSPH